MADKKILISGYFGFGNCGDEIILNVERERFESLGYDVKYITADNTRKSAVSRNFFDTFRAISKSDVIISGGGGLLQDKTSLKSLFYYLFILYAGFVLRKKTVCFAQGIGPLDTLFGRFLTGRVISRVNLITVRDRYSKNVLIKCGIKKPVNICSDVAFLFYGKEEIRLPCRKFVIFSPGYSLRMPSIETLADIAKIIKEESELPVIIVPLYPERDGKVAYEISQRTGFPVVIPDKIGQYLYMFERSEFVVGMRYHSVVLSALARKAFVSMSYDPKVSAISEEFGLNFIENYAKMTKERFSEIFSLNFKNRRNIERKMEIKLSEMKKRAEKNFILFKEMFGS